jgi:hypothetical protein
VVGTHEKSDWTRRAIDVMTAWSGAGENPQSAADRVVAYASEGPGGAMELIAGFINLSAILLYQIESMSGLDLPTTLQHAAKFTLEPLTEG